MHIKIIVLIIATTIFTALAFVGRYSLMAGRMYKQYRFTDALRVAGLFGVMFAVGCVLSYLIMQWLFTT